MSARTLQLYIATDGDAFHDGDGNADPVPELVRILREVACSMESEPNGHWRKFFQTIHDVNGNDVGRWALKLTSGGGL